MGECLTCRVPLGQHGALKSWKLLSPSHTGEKSLASLAASPLPSPPLFQVSNINCGTAWAGSPWKNFYTAAFLHLLIKLFMPEHKMWIVIQFSSVAQSCLTLCDPMNRSAPGLPVHHQLLEFTQTHVHWVSDAIQPSHPLSSPSPPALSLSQHQGLFKWVSSLHQVA